MSFERARFSLCEWPSDVRLPPAACLSVCASIKAATSHTAPLFPPSAPGITLPRDALQDVRGSARAAVPLSDLPLVEDRALSLHWGEAVWLEINNSWKFLRERQKKKKRQIQMSISVLSPLRTTMLLMDYTLCSGWTRKESQRILFSADLSVSGAVNNGFISVDDSVDSYRLGKQ